MAARILYNDVRIMMRRRAAAMRRLLCLIVLACLLVAPARAEGALTLPECTTVKQVQALILYPEEGQQPVEVERGKVRYIAQNPVIDPDFCPEYWYGGDQGSELDLTLEKAPGNRTYAYYAGNMCTRAVYAMALSYLGINMSPGRMSALTGRRVVNAPYDEITEMLPQLERVSYSTFVFKRMYENYLTDSSYSPVYLYIQKPGGTTHALLVVGQQEDGRYIVVDPNYHATAEGRAIRVYTIMLTSTAQRISGSDFRGEQAGSIVKGLCQWHLIE